jgi:lipid-A-disaccharide synthase
MSRRVFITVAERSADQHAANLVRALKTLDPSIEVHALGGEALRSAGAIVHHDTVANAAMGLAAFKRAAEVKRRLAWTKDFYQRNPIDLHICCDSWTMNVHFARLAKSMNVPVFYYIAPQAWASRESRVHELARLADHVACILPFEEPFLRSRGVNATFVGHPLFDELSTVDARMSNREVHAATPSDVPHSTLRSRTFPLIALPCGSRAGVARANLPRQLAVARRIRDAFPEATFVVPTVSATHDIVLPMIHGLSYVRAELDGFDQVIPGCDLAITVSGTATLHIAAHGVPMIVVYAGSRILWNLIGRWMIKIRTFAMVNLLANEGRDEPANHIVPEFIPWNGPVDAVVDHAIATLRDPARLADQRANLKRMVDTINQPGASHNAAKLAMELLGDGVEDAARRS